MQPLLHLFLSVVLATTATFAQGETDCPAFHVNAKDCCNFEGILPGAIKDGMKKCKHLTFPGKKMKTISEVHDISFCHMECVFSEEGLLTADMKLDKSAISEFWSGSAPVDASAKDTCLSRQLAPEPSRQCKSGTRQFVGCLNRETFLNCPTALWAGTAECQQVKDTIARCPDTVVFFKIPPNTVV